MAFEFRITARFFEIDRAGIVFFGRVYSTHTPRWKGARSAFGHPEAMFSSLGGMPLVHSEADYQHPIRMGDKLVVSMTVQRLGRSSVTFDYEMIGEDQIPAVACG